MKKCRIFYFTLTDEMRKEEKLEWFAYNKIDQIPFEHIIPDKNNNWLDLTDNDWEELIPVANKETKLSKSKNDENAIFKLFSLGVVTARDEWVYDYELKNLERKVNFLINSYNCDVEKLKHTEKSALKDKINYQIKWTRAVKNDLSKGKMYNYSDKHVVKSLYRPFTISNLYFAKELNEMQYQLNRLFLFDPVDYNSNRLVAISGTSTNKPFSSLATNTPYCYDLLEKTQCLPLYRYDTDGNRIDNITDWGLEQFRVRYGEIPPNPLLKKGEMREVSEVKEGLVLTKEDIFHYVYGVLHNPEYRKKYEMTLKREFPRVPFYDDFWQWASWGKELMDLHINFETVEPYPLKTIEQEFTYDREPKAKLKADKENGKIVLDEITTLSGIPAEVWEYKLGNRSALEWILDQYKEKKPKDPTIAEKFNTYRFADYKSKVIDLLMRVTTVSVETVRIVKEMGK